MEVSGICKLCIYAIISILCTSNLYIHKIYKHYTYIINRTNLPKVIYELLCVYILNLLGEKYGKERVGLYRDDGLACFANVSAAQSEQLGKMLLKEEFHFNITSETNLKIISFLDITGKYKTYNKADNDPLYLDVYSKNFHDTTKKQINKLSSNEHQEQW